MSNEQVHYLRYRICVHPLKKTVDGMDVTNHYSQHELKVLDFPQWVIKRRTWLINVWTAKMQLRFPKHQIRINVAGYWFPEIDEETNKKRKISAAKSQISRVQGLIEERKKQMSTQLFQDFGNDPFIIKANLKLLEKKQKLEQLLNT